MLPSIRYFQTVFCQNGNGCLYSWGAYYHDCTVVRHVHVYLIWIFIPFCLHGFQVDRCLLALQSEVENFVLRMAAEFPDSKEQLIFLINNYDMMLAVPPPPPAPHPLTSSTPSHSHPLTPLPPPSSPPHTLHPHTPSSPFTPSHPTVTPSLPHTLPLFP